ncbi:hypothetical protein [Streptomyces sp. NPDC127103]|uniref:hypothetical protein n=1 Tax=Streptomyces sp. NPDC127103 TaxID=3347139 RepID=UPI00365B4CDD
MQTSALVPHARLPRTYHDRHVLTSTVDAFGTAHWLLTARAPAPGGDRHPYDALVVSVREDGGVEVTELSALRARFPHLDRLPDGGFVVASARARRADADGSQVQGPTRWAARPGPSPSGTRSRTCSPIRAVPSGSDTSTRIRRASAAGARRVNSNGNPAMCRGPAGSWTATP